MTGDRLGWEQDMNKRELLFGGVIDSHVGLHQQLLGKVEAQCDSA